jgi:hypothetical protein
MADAAREVRPAIYELAKQRSWTLYELHQATRSLEDLFRELTKEDRDRDAGKGSET